MKLLLAFLCAANAATNTHTATVTLTGSINVPWSTGAAATNLDSLGGSASDTTTNVAKRTKLQKQLCTAILDIKKFRGKATACTSVISDGSGSNATPSVPNNEGSKVVFTMTGFKTNKTTTTAVNTEIDALWPTGETGVALNVVPTAGDWSNANVRTPIFTKATTWRAASNVVKSTATTTTKATTKTTSGALGVCASVSMMILGFMNVL